MSKTNDAALNPLNLAFLERLYADHVRNPEAVPQDWRGVFEDLREGGNGHEGQAEPKLGPSFSPPGLFRPARYRVEPVREGRDRDGGDVDRAREAAALQDRVDQLVRAYRVRGHMIARIDPLGLPRPAQPELDPAHYGLTDADMERPVSCRTIGGGGELTLRQLIERMQNTYCRSIGVQFMHIDDLDIRHWLQDRMEGTENRLHLSRAVQLRILTRLTHAVVFEAFVQKKYIGAKSFSLEGCESLIPLLDLAIERAGEHGLDEIVLGMSHRGRLNVLVNIMGKRPQDVFREFEDVDARQNLGGGDVKYHLGHDSSWTTSAGQHVHLSLCFNPSHLEFVDPVVVGRVRAKQDRAGDRDRRRKMGLIIHGDAAFAGEGIVQETLNLSELPAYWVGGTVHVIVNNQIGFTTCPSEGRSSIYASAVAKMLQVPIFHVNGEDPEAVAQVMHLAMEFRRLFRRDVVIDMYGYRRHGHNESDEPSFTQPVLYKAIRERPSVRDGYLENLLKLEGITREEADRIEERCRDDLERGLSVARSDEYAPLERSQTGIWAGYHGGPERHAREVDTRVDQDRLVALLKRLTYVPDEFRIHPRLERFLKPRREMAEGKRAIDWSTAEALAFASLATEGIRVRLTGQDTARGTFSQRHAVLYDVEGGDIYEPFQNLADGQAPVEIRNSPLSEAGVMGFEYGYSLDCPDGLTLWEAQFGDFCNAAQVIIDQFLVSAEDKWKQLSGLVLLLPHGFEGQGPEHASARLERFLMLTAEDNIQVVNPSTPTQYFHLLRRQVLRPWRKPLIVMTPKSLLRHPRVVSDLEGLAEGGFERFLPDEHEKPGKVKRVLMCSGKVYYELVEHREELGREDVAIIRLEQLYPLRDEVLQSALAPFPDGTPVYWVQEEPENMGAWRYLKARFCDQLPNRMPFCGVFRPESASPETGSKAAHKLEQQEVLDQAFGDPRVCV